jgi:hypothetical protein
MKFQLGAMSVGDILDRGLKILFSRLGTFYAINLILLLPLLAIELAIPWMVESNANPNPIMLLASIPIFLIVAIILGSVAGGATIEVIGKTYVDEPVSAGSAIRYAFGRLGALIGTSFLVGVIVIIGLALCFVPGIIFALMYAVANQVVMLEGRSGGAAMSRSAELTSGFRGRVFGVIFLVILVTGLLNLGLQKGLAIAFPPGGDVLQTATGFEMKRYNHPNYEINMVAGFVVQVLLGAYQSICLTLLYFDLRVRKEGFDLEVAARQQLTPE